MIASAALLVNIMQWEYPLPLLELRVLLNIVLPEPNNLKIMYHIICMRFVYDIKKKTHTTTSLATTYGKANRRRDAKDLYSIN